MNFDFTLTSEQQALVEDNLSVIGKTINLFICPDEDVEGLGLDDLYQEGAMALCKAAATYDGTSAQFSTYATTVIRNHLYNCCKKANTRQRKLPSVSLDIDHTERNPTRWELGSPGQRQNCGKISYCGNSGRHNEEKAPPVLTAAQGGPLFYKLYDIVWRTPNNVTQLFQGEHGDIFVLFQRIKGFVVNARLQKLVLGYTACLHRFP